MVDNAPSPVPNQGVLSLSPSETEEFYVETLGDIANAGYRTVRAVLDALRSLPVEQRMEAMGMVRGATFCEEHGLAWLASHWCPCDDVSVFYEEATDA